MSVNLLTGKESKRDWSISILGDSPVRAQYDWLGLAIVFLGGALASSAVKANVSNFSTSILGPDGKWARSRKKHLHISVPSKTKFITGLGLTAAGFYKIIRFHQGEN
jgi:hypothetical protein